MKIQVKLALNALMPLFAACLAALIFYTSHRHIAQLRGMRTSTDIVLRAVFELQTITLDYLRHPEQRTREQWMTGHASLGALLAQSKENSASKDRLENIRKSHAAMRDTFVQLSAIVKPPEPNTLATDDLEGRLNVELAILSRNIVADALALSNAVEQSVCRAEHAADKLVVVCLLCCALAIAGFAVLVGYRIMRPIRALHRGVTQVGLGHLDHRIEVRGHDEITLLSHAFNNMIAATKASRTALQGEIAERQRAEQRVNHLNAVLRAIRDVNALLGKVQTVNTLLYSSCRRLVETRGYFTAWIGLFSDDRRLVSCGHAGFGDSFAPMEAAMREANLPRCALDALGTEGLTIYTDIVEPCRDCPTAPLCSQGSVMSTRIMAADRVRGVLVVSLPEDAAADADEQMLFHELAGDIGFALHSLETEQGRRQAEAELAVYRQNLEELVAQRTTELQEALSELARSNQELEHFAYVASHDLKEPLRKIKSFTDLLQQRCGPELDEQSRQYIGYAVDAAGRMQLMIEDLLTYSRAGRAELLKTPTDLHALLENVVSDLGPLLAESHAQVEVEPLPTLAVSASHIGMVFRNLIANAVKFRGKDPPLVRIRAQRIDHQWVLSVRDNGIGIDPKYFPRLFLIFQRLHTRAEYPGSGIGLALCKRIVERHGGRIWIESEPGKGATFFFTLPDSPPPPETQTATDQVPAPEA